MQCELGRELISAGLDDELGASERSALDRHLETCEDCTAYAAAAARLHRSSRVVPAAPVPDLTDAILGRLDGVQAPDTEPPRSIGSDSDPRAGRRPRRPPGRSDRSADARRSRRVFALQYGLLVVALSMVVLSVPELLATTGAAIHATRHLGVWDLAFAVGLLVAALQPWRARGLLPMAAALGCAMALTAGLDLSRGVTTGIAELSHLLEVLGLVFLWLLSRAAPIDSRLGPARRAAGGLPVARPRGPRALDPLRAWAGSLSGPAAPDVRPVARDESDDAERAA